MTTITVEITRKTQIDTTPDLSWIEDETRRDGYGRDWRMIGIQAEAKISLKNSSHTITSDGSWGIQSDSSFDYFNEVFEEETAAILDTVRQLTQARDIQIIIN